jgi:predicted Zn-dependent peptidase
MHQALFKETSYAIDRMGSEASVAGISPNAVQAWYDTFVKNRKPVVIAVGDTSGTALAAYFVKHFSGSRMQETKIQEEYTRPLEKGLSIEETWNRGESLILFGFQAPPEDDEDGYATRVLQSYAGEMGRFSQEIRDRLGIAYKVGVVYEPRLRGGSIIASAAADPKNEEAVVTAFREEIKRLTDNPVAYRDFRSAVNQAVGAHAIRTQVRCMQIRDLADNLLAGKGKEGYYALTNGIQEVSEEDLKGITRRIFNMDKGVILRVHGRAR